MLHMNSVRLEPMMTLPLQGKVVPFEQELIGKRFFSHHLFLCVKEELYHGMLWNEKNQKQTLKIEANASTAPSTRKWFKTSSVTEDRTSCVHSVKLKKLQKETCKLMKKIKILYQTKLVWKKVYKHTAQINQTRKY